MYAVLSGFELYLHITNVWALLRIHLAKAHIKPLDLRRSGLLEALQVMVQPGLRPCTKQDC